MTPSEVEVVAGKPDVDAAKIARGLDAQARDDLVIRWDRFCDAEPLDCFHDEYLARMGARGFMNLVPVTSDALEDAFAYKRGIEPGGMMYELTPLGLAVRAHLERQR